MRIKHKIWLEKNGEVIFGSGRYELFKAIDESHSLNAAAKKLKMSYRAAWGRVKASEERMGTKLVERTQGKGMYLTAEAVALLRQFDLLEQKTGVFLEETSQNLLLPFMDKTTVKSSKKSSPGSEPKK